jgi:hypothetical protein
MRRSVWRLMAVALLGAMGLSPRPAMAWGPLGHQVIAVLADRLLEKSDPAARAKLLDLLAADTERGKGKGKGDIAAAATWLDALAEHSEEARGATRTWHATRLKFDNPDLKRDCFGRPPLPAGYPASHGPQDDCSVNKVTEFVKELQDPATSAGERLSALRFLLALTADVSDPLLAIDRGDSGGACVALAIGTTPTPVRLSSYWDETLVKMVVGGSPASGATRIVGGISAADAAAWQVGSVEDWLQDSYTVAKSTVYSFAGTAPSGKYTFPATKGVIEACSSVDLYKVGADYETKALATVKQQLAKGGERLAAILGQSLK